MLKEIADRVYVEDGFEGGNVGLVLTARGAILIDTPMLPPDARRWQLTLLQLGVETIYGIVNTDYHPEHFLGDTFFMPTRVFSHESAAKAIAKYSTSTLEQVGDLYRDQDPALANEIDNLEICEPEISVSDRVTLYLGDRQVQVLHLDGHTPASLGVYLPAERVLFAGDNITWREPPVMSQANSRAWLRTLQYIQGLEVDQIVPGVGEICAKADIDVISAYITDMRQQVTGLFQRGASRRETVDKVALPDYFTALDDNSARLKRRRRENIERVYTEVRTSLRKKGKA